MSTARPFAEAQSERDFSDAVVEYARLCGWLVHRDPTWRATGTDPGYPDLTLVHSDGRIIWAELKVGRGKTTPAQDEWLDRLSIAAIRDHYPKLHVWRPSDWPTIEKELR